MSTVGLQDLPQEIFSGQANFIPTPDLPPGASPACQDVKFQMGSWMTRPGLKTIINGFPNQGMPQPSCSYLKTFTDNVGNNDFFFFDSAGNLSLQYADGSIIHVLTTGATGPYLTARSVTQFGREWFAPSDGKFGISAPFKATPQNVTFANAPLIERVSQSGPGFPPTAADGINASPGISAGVHGIAVMFVTDQQYITKPSPLLAPNYQWTAAGGHLVSVTGIPIGPANVIQRILCFTAAGGANFFYIPNSFMVINDNTTTTVTGQFLDAALLSGTNVDSFFNKVELGECSAVASYKSRLFWFGERNKIENAGNLGFDGGWSLGGGTGGSDLPLGWASDVTFGAGGSRFQGDNVLLDSYKITANGTPTIGMITIPIAIDALGVPIIQPATAYSIRVRVTRSANLNAGQLVLEAHKSLPSGFLGTPLSITPSQIPQAGVFTEFIASWIPVLPGLVPSTLTLRVYATGTPGPVGEYFIVDSIEIFPTLTPFNSGLARASKSLDPETYDGQSGLLIPELPEGDRLVTGFKLREKFYMSGTRSLFVTEDDGINEPSGWSIDEVSNLVGLASPAAVGFGEEWVILAGRSGAYILWAGIEPIKISQEIQPTWDTINWAAGQVIWAVVDTQLKRLLIGVPTGVNTTVNQILYMDYQGLDSAADIASYHSVRYSAYSGKILAIGDARKWAPWTIAAGGCGLIEQTDGTRHTYFGNAVGNGKIYDLLDSQKNDDGVGIPWSYTTHAMPAPIDRQMLKLGSGRMLFGYLSGYVEGTGQMLITAQPLGNITQKQVGVLTLIDPTGPLVPIQKVTRAFGVVTVITTAPHGFVNGVDTQAILNNVADPSFNGTWALQVVSNPNQFSVYQYGLPDATSAGGTAQRLVRRFELTTDVVGERVTWTFSNSGNTAGTWVKMQELIPWVAPEPWAPVRGVMN